MKVFFGPFLRGVGQGQRLFSTKRSRLLHEKIRKRQKKEPDFSPGTRG